MGAMTKYGVRCVCRPCAFCRRAYVAPTPLWVRALEAWAEHEYPNGANGRSAALRVVSEVKRHARRLQRFAAAAAT